MCCLGILFVLAIINLQRMSNLCDGEVDTVRQWGYYQSTVQPHVFIAIRERSTALTHK